MSNILFKNNVAQVTATSINQESCLAANSLEDSQFETNSILALSHPHCEAKVSLFGGQTLSYQPVGHKDALWLSKQASFAEGKAIRGGVPICWPWFGPIDEQPFSQNKVAVNINKVKPQKHGFARQLLWRVASINADALGITLVLTLSGEGEHQVWPNAFNLTQTLFFGENFKQSLSMTNLSQQDTQYSAGLHNYFAVSNPANVSIDTLTGVNYLDELTSHKGIQEQSVSCVGEIDRKYESSETMIIDDQKWQRKITVVSDNCQAWVLWNPGTELASNMSDIHAGGEHEYVCLEPANTTLQALPAGETVVISQVINVEKYS